MNHIWSKYYGSVHIKLNSHCLASFDLVYCGKEKAESQGETVDLAAHLRPHPRPWAVGSYRKRTVMNLHQLWTGRLLDMSSVRRFIHPQLGHAGEIMSLSWFGNTYTTEELEVEAEEREVCLDCCPIDQQWRETTANYPVAPFKESW